MGVEGFTILAVLEANDRISRVLEHVDGAMDRFSSATARAAETAQAAGERIDTGLLQTASGADALELAAARTATAQEKLTAATTAQAQAETALLDARAAAASEEELAAAADALASAQQRATASTTELKEAQAALATAKKAKVSEAEIAAAADAVTAAQQRAAAATAELTAAQERQAALVAPSDIAAAAAALTAAEKAAAKATTEASAAQERQAAVERAQAAASGDAAAATTTAAGAQSRLGTSATSAAAGGGLLAKSMKFAAVGVAAVGVLSVKTAGDFESMTQHLVTDAGESQKNIGMIRAGMLALATTTGTTTTQMAQGMYHIESAGFHGKAALDVLKAAAEGAKVGGADLDGVGKTLTGTMNSYSAAGYSATQMMNMLITTVGQGDMKMNDLASSLGSVAPAAAAAGISFGQVGGAIATMTAQNMSAARATMDLNHTIQSLENPTSVQSKEMQAMGLSANDVSKNLGKRGLSGTLDMLVSAIAAHNKNGMVFQATLKNSEVAAADAKTALAALPPSIQGVAKGLLDGSVTVTQYNKAIKDMPLAQKGLAQQFASLVRHSQSFNDLLKSGSPQAQTFNAALAKMTGGTVGLTTALMLTGGRAQTFADNARKISETGRKAGDSVDNWDKIQGTFNQKIDRVKASVEAAGIAIGTALLPAVSQIASIIAAVVGPMASWISQHQKWVGLALAVAGAVGAVVLALKAWEIVQGVMNGLMAIFAGEETAILGPIELVVIAIAALAVGLIYAYTHFKTFHDIVNSVMRAVKIAVVDTARAMETAWRAVVIAAQATGRALQTAWNAVVGAAMAVWHALQTAWDAVSSVTMAVWGAISGFFQKWWPLLLMIFMPPIALLLAIWNHFHEEIIGTAKAVWNAVSAFLAGAWHGIETVARVTWELVKTFVIKPMEEAWAAIQPIIHAVESFLSAAWHGILSVVTTIWDGIKKAIIDPLTSAWHTVTSTVDHIKSAIKTGLDQAWAAVSDIGNEFIQIGQDIINGIIQGVENAAGSLFSSVGSVAHGALHAAKSILGIGSPSREFADQVGKWIPHGIAAGVDKYAGVAHQAIARLSAGMLGVGAAAPSLAGAFAVGGAGYEGGSTGPSVVNLHLHMEGARIMSDRDMTQLVDKVGRVVATKLLPQGGVRLAT
ncbi:MAG: phage tail tape measure protein [Catenulispora sp.]|nr:phage tail tape measure protein [Catenulispora sp.]